MTQYRIQRVLRGGCFVWSASLLVSAAAVAEPRVAIDGGPDVTGHNYEWSISHDHDAPLIHVEFAHYRGDMFFAPDGWSIEIENPNSSDFTPGKCVADSATGLARGQRGEFTLRINAAGAFVGRGDFLCRFADGIELRVPADVPVKRQSPIEPYATPAAMGGMFIVFLLVRAIRARRRKPAG